MTRETFEGFQTRPTLAAHQHFSIIVSLIEAERRAGVHTPRQTAPLPQRWNQSGDGLRQELLLTIVQHLVDAPSQVAVSATEGQHTMILSVTVAPWMWAR